MWKEINEAGITHNFYIRARKMAAPRQHRNATSSISRTEQEIFAQRKLEDLFKNTYQRLYEYRNAVGFAQEALVWRRPVAAAVLYAAIHWVFM